MDFEFKLPDIGEGITEGEIVAWHVKEGDPIKEDDALVDVMTDKATVTISSPKSGTIKQRRFAEGAMAPVGDVLVVIALGGAEAPRVAAQSPAPSPAPSPAAATAPAAPEPQAAPPVAPKRSPEPQVPPVAARAAAPAAPAAAPPGPAAPALDQPTAPTLATPATRRLARELNVDVHDVKGTGKGGRITKEDVLAFAAALRRAPAQTAPTGAASVPPDPQGREERTPLRGLRRRIHAKMTVAKHTAAHFHYVDEVDMTALVALRDRTKARAERSGVKLTFLPFFVKAAVAALKEHPLVNSAMDDSTEEIVLRKYYDIGIAAATEAGLVVPVVHDADRKSVYDIARDIERLAEKARDGKLDREDVTGSTFTITSLGKLGGMFATPIVNHPEVAILGIHKIEKRPVVVGDQIVIRERMYLSSSFDHRVVDGHVGAAFVQRVKELLEEPESLLLEMA